MKYRFPTVDILPQKPPFRFVEKVVDYKPNHYIQASMHTKRFCDSICLSIFPASCVIEGLAQTTILLVTLESRPFKENEFPLLGRISIENYYDVKKGEEIFYTVSPVKLLSNKGIVNVSCRGHEGKNIASGTIVVGITTKTKYSDLRRECR